MFGSEKAFSRPQESAAIRSEERIGQNSLELINSQNVRAKEAFNNNKQLISVLVGEKAFNKIKATADADEQIELAMEIIKKVPFVVKHIPDHLSDKSEQAGFLVSVVLADTKGEYTVQ